MEIKKKRKKKEYIYIYIYFLWSNTHTLYTNIKRYITAVIKLEKGSSHRSYSSQADYL